MYKIRNIQRGWWQWKLHRIEPPSRAYVLISDLRLSRRPVGDPFLIAVPSAALPPCLLLLDLVLPFRSPSHPHSPPSPLHFRFVPSLGVARVPVHSLLLGQHNTQQVSKEIFLTYSVWSPHVAHTQFKSHTHFTDGEVEVQGREFCDLLFILLFLINLEAIQLEFLGTAGN